MSPVTHLLISWSLANIKEFEKRDRAIITLSGLSPDVDGLGVLIDFATGHFEQPFYWWNKLHHVVGHNLFFALGLSLVTFWFAKNKKVTPLMVFLAFHIHLLGDLLGARGPDGYQWPIPYFYPLADAFQLVWPGQWALNSWQNMLITLITLIIMFIIARNRGYSPLEIISTRLDHKFIQTIRNRFGNPGEQGSGIKHPTS